MIIFEKPENLKYTDMAIWIDNNAYSESCDENKLYEYIYHIVKMLAYKAKYFKDSDTYEDFSCYAATRTYFRLKNKKQSEVKLDGTPRMNKVKSILNFLKSTVYPMKVDYEQSTYSQNNQSDNPHMSLDELKVDYTQLRDKCTDNGFDRIYFESYINQLARVIKSFLKKIPEFSQKDVWNNIYLSCLMTLLDSITLTNKDKQILNSLSYSLYDDKLDKLHKKESHNPAILFHLPESMNNYIVVLCNRLKKLIAKDLSDLISSYETPESVVKYAILESVNDLYENEEYD